jgi:hypothetical protein
MASKKPGSHDMTPRKSSRRKAAGKKAAKTAVIKSAAEKKQASKWAALRIAKTAAKKMSARKPVPIKTARVGKRALLPPLPPPPAAPLKMTRSPARASRAKAAAGNTAARKGSKTFAITACSEAVLREKLRLAAPYVKVWLSRVDDGNEDLDTSSAEAAFVRIWQWFDLEASLEDGRVVSTGMLSKLLAEELAEEASTA